MKRRSYAADWPCVFAGQFFKTQVAARLYERDPKTPFGAFMRLWRQFHCTTVNPYGSVSSKGTLSLCPYAEEDCAIAFLMAAEEALGARRSRVGLFRAIARTKGLDRAENKPLARDAIVRTDGQQSRAGDLRGGPRERPSGVVSDHLGDRVPNNRPGAVPVDRAVDLRRSTHRPQSMGELLRGDGAGPRTRAYGRHEGEETADHDGDAGNPVSPPSSERLGNQPPSGDPDLHQGGE